MSNEKTIALIKERLAALAPTHIEIIDDSHKHIGHPGNTGGGHFTLIISSEKFNSDNMVGKHQEIYALVNDLIPEKIHALSIKIIQSTS